MTETLISHNLISLQQKLFLRLKQGKLASKSDVASFVKNQILIKNQTMLHQIKMS